MIANLGKLLFAYEFVKNIYPVVVDFPKSKILCHEELDVGYTQLSKVKLVNPLITFVGSET